MGDQCSHSTWSNEVPFVIAVITQTRHVNEVSWNSRHREALAETWARYEAPIALRELSHR
ncbi:hypothetical protein CTTA_3437 [Comamonas testosteroni]|uniref:Uncharacterized protein n=1 Tax=Comamonas testosteroni TaxID=285 RepID=A0A5A7MFG5_COMTE|nr:hypothetical protein CTTA_3437 [Comamonas testosteroni]